MKTLPADPKHAKLLGRYLFDDGKLWLTSTCATVECDVNASYFAFELEGDPSAHKGDDGSIPGNVVRYALYIDGSLQKVECMDESRRTLVVVDQKEKRRCTATLIKLTESSQSYIAVTAFTTDDDGSVTATIAKSRRVEYIGDSITCGYGVESKDENECFSTLTEDGTKAYAYLAAKETDADYCMASYSSFGVVSGWTDSGDLNDFSLVPRIYDKVCFSWNTQMFADRDWDFSLFKAQVIVFNLGTNDMSYCKDDAKCEAFTDCYVQFLKHVRSINEKAHFILSIGIMEMGEVMAPWVEKTVKKYAALTGDGNISYFHFGTQTKEEGYGAGFHPSIPTQERCGKALAAELKKWF